MQQTAHQIDTATLRELKPLSSLNDNDLRRLAACANIIQLEPGERLAVSAHKNDKLDYLLAGDIDLLNVHRAKQRVHQDTLQARNPLNEALIQYSEIRARSHSALLRIDQERLEQMLQTHWDKGYEIEELQIESDAHSMSSLLQNRCLLALPPDNIETVLALMTPVEIKAGEMIIEQGSKNDGYYTIIAGRAKVTRRPSDNAEEILLAELGPGASFGEEALITDECRNASITMITAGILMRLDKVHFNTYVVDELLENIEYSDMIKRLRNGAKLIDVRSTDEFVRNGHGMHIPSPMLRLRLQNLSKGREYIFCCNNGKQSTAAAFIATQLGFRASILDKGLDALPQEYLCKDS